MHCIPPVPGCMISFDNDSKRIFVTTVKKEWAFRRKLCPGGFPHSPSAYRQGAREHPRGSPRKRSQRVVRQNEPVAGFRSLGPEVQESLAMEKTIHPKKESKEGRLCVEESLAIELYCPP